MKENNIKGIIFDWSGVFCIPGEPFSHPLLREKLNLTPDEMGQRAQAIQDLYYRGQITSAEFWERVRRFFNLSGPTTVELNQAYLNSYKVYPEMLELARQLKKRYQTILLSNLTNEIMNDLIEKYQVKDYFHQTIFSNEVGLLKPESEIFTLAIDRLGLPTTETIFIDDSKTHVATAQQFGLITVLFESPEQCRKELINLGVQCD